VFLCIEKQESKDVVNKDLPPTQMAGILESNKEVDSWYNFRVCKRVVRVSPWVNTILLRDSDMIELGLKTNSCNSIGITLRNKLIDYSEMEGCSLP
jgi:hypothetical protein